MDKKRMLQIIDFEPEVGKVTEEDQLEAYTMYFELFGVAVKNSDGTYKSLYDIFEEAHNNLYQHILLELLERKKIKYEDY